MTESAYDDEDDDENDNLANISNLFDDAVKSEATSPFGQPAQSQLPNCMSSFFPFPSFSLLKTLEL